MKKCKKIILSLSIMMILLNVIVFSEGTDILGYQAKKMLAIP